MSSVRRQDSMDSLDNSYLSDVLVEAPTLSSKEMDHARLAGVVEGNSPKLKSHQIQIRETEKQALKILETKSPEEAIKIFTKGPELKADVAREKAHTPTMPPKGADAKANGTVQQTSPPTN